MNYQDRVVLFIDVLGFRNIINSTLDEHGSDAEDKIEYLYNIFMLIRDVLDMDSPSHSETRKVTQFSDSIVISFSATERSEVFHTLFLVQLMLGELILKGFLCRGGVAYGKLIHDDKVVFGPALNKAYDAESRAALFPRVILDESIISLGATYHATHHLPEHEIDSIRNIVTQDTDNMYYIDYFEKSFENLNDPYYDTPGYIEALREIILPYLNSDKLDLMVKYGWMINKFNEMIKDIKEYRASEGFHEPDADLDDYYQNLEYI